MKQITLPVIKQRAGAAYAGVVRTFASASQTRRAILAVALGASILAMLYWTIIASDRYVSEAHVLIQKTDLPGVAPADLGGLLAGITNSGNRPDQMLLRDHMLSVDMLKKLDAQLNLRDHYSGWGHDPLSKLWSSEASMERFHAYFLTRVKVEYDDHEGLLVVEAQAYDPKMAQAIVSALLRNGEQFMNTNDHLLARAQVDFLEEEVARMNERNIAARRELLAFQNREGMASPEDTARQIEGIVAQLEGRRAVLETQLRAMGSYLVPDHPQLVTLRQELAAIDQQIAEERSRVASPGGSPLNSKAERFQRLEQQAAFTQQIYNTTLAALEKGRIDAMRTVKKVTILQSPTLPESATKPSRLYNSLVFALASFLLAGIALLLAAIVRDHLD
jgi:capsular polysaccharide transport system permease protein